PALLRPAHRPQLPEARSRHRLSGAARARLDVADPQLDPLFPRHGGDERGGADADQLGHLGGVQAVVLHPRNLPLRSSQRADAAPSRARRREARNPGPAARMSAVLSIRGLAKTYATGVEALK